MSKAEMTMTVHDVQPTSLRFERQDLQAGGDPFTVVDLVCDTEDGNQIRLKMFMGGVGHHPAVTVAVGDLTVVGEADGGPSWLVLRALVEYAEQLDLCSNDAHAKGNACDAQSCSDRATEVRRLIGSMREGGNDGAQAEDG